MKRTQAPPPKAAPKKTRRVRKEPLGQKLKDQDKAKRKAERARFKGKKIVTHQPIVPMKDQQFPYWKFIKRVGRRPAFTTPEELLDECIEYFKYMDEHPDYEYKVVGTSFGEAIVHDIPKRKPYTIGTLCIYIGISTTTWTCEYKNKALFSDICNMVEQAIREQKFNGGTLGFFNSNIIAKDLGMVDKKEVTGENGTPLIPPAQRDEQARATRLAMIADLLNE